MINAVTGATTPARNRTRRAILDAALEVLNLNPSASLGEVADAAGVARSTLHRYFPERSDLLTALTAYANESIAAATERARMNDGVAAEALIRLCHEYFDIWNALNWVYTESLKQAPVDCEPEQEDPGLTTLIERGHSDGTIDPSLPGAWIQQMLWALLYAASEHMREQGATRHEAISLCLTTLRKIMSPANRG